MISSVSWYYLIEDKSRIFVSAILQSLVQIMAWRRPNNAGILLIWPLGTNFSEMLIEILRVSLRKMRLKGSYAKWRPFCLGLNLSNWGNAAYPVPPSFQMIYGPVQAGVINAVLRPKSFSKLWMKYAKLYLYFTSLILLINLFHLDVYCSEFLIWKVHATTRMFHTNDQYTILRTGI